MAFATPASIQYQRGRTDQLTGVRYKIYRARNFLKTITRALADDHKRIQLPDHMIQLVLSDAHEWIGGAALDIGEMAEARSNFFRSLRLRPGQPRTAALLMISMLPIGVGRALRRVYWALKHRLVKRPGTGENGKTS